MVWKQTFLCLSRIDWVLNVLEQVSQLYLIFSCMIFLCLIRFVSHFKLMSHWSHLNLFELFFVCFYLHTYIFTIVVEGSITEMWFSSDSFLMMSSCLWNFFAKVTLMWICWSPCNIWNIHNSSKNCIWSYKTERKGKIKENQEFWKHFQSWLFSILKI